MERAEDSASKIRCKAALCELGIPSTLAVGAVKIKRPARIRKIPVKIIIFAIFNIFKKL